MSLDTKLEGKDWKDSIHFSSFSSTARFCARSGLALILAGTALATACKPGDFPAPTTAPAHYATAALTLPTPTPTLTATITPTPTKTSTPTPTATIFPTPAFTPRPTPAHTPLPIATVTPRPTATYTPTPTLTPTQIDSVKIEIRPDGFYRDGKRIFIGTGVNFRILDYDNNFGGYNRVTNYPDQVKTELSAIGSMSQKGTTVIRVGLLDSGVNYFKGEGNYGYIRDDVITFLQWAKDSKVMIEFVIADYLLAARHPDALTNPAIRSGITQNFLDRLLKDIKMDNKAFSALWGFDLYNEPEWSVSQSFGGGWEHVTGEKPNQPVPISDINAYLNEVYATIRSIAPDKFITLGVSAKHLSVIVGIQDKLDYFAVHHYAWMGPLESYISQIPTNKPWMLEEYPSRDEGRDVEPATYLDDLLSQWKTGKPVSGGSIWMWKPIRGQKDNNTSYEMVPKLKSWAVAHQNELEDTIQTPTTLAQPLIGGLVRN